MSVETEQMMRQGLDGLNQFAQKMRTNDAAISDARSGHSALQTSMNGVHSDAGAQRANLAAGSAGQTTDNATGTSVDLEKEVQDVVDQSAEIESAVTEAAEALKLGQIKNDQIRDEIIKDIADTMAAVAALRQQPDGNGKAAAQKLLTELVQRVQQKTGRSADNAQQTIQTLSGIAGNLGGDGGQGTSASSAGSSGSSQPPAAFNTQGSSGSGGSGGGGGTTASAAGGGASKPRLPVATPPQPGSGVDVNLPGGKTVQAPNEKAAKAVRSALGNLGVPYVWGGTSPGKGLDCSGLTMTAYQDAGVDLPRKSNQQTVGAEVPSEEDLLPGDLVVWSGHVAMVIGDGQMVEAGDPVQVSDIRTSNSGQSFIGFYRPTG